jgi:hypothetical protein
MVSVDARRNAAINSVRSRHSWNGVVSRDGIHSDPFVDAKRIGEQNRRKERFRVEGLDSWSLWLWPRPASHRVIATGWQRIAHRGSGCAEVNDATTSGQARTSKPARPDQLIEGLAEHRWRLAMRAASG